MQFSTRARLAAPPRPPLASSERTNEHLSTAPGWLQRGAQLPHKTLFGESNERGEGDGDETTAQRGTARPRRRQRLQQQHSVRETARPAHSLLCVCPRPTPLRWRCSFCSHSPAGVIMKLVVAVFPLALFPFVYVRLAPAQLPQLNPVRVPPPPPPLQFCCPRRRAVRALRTERIVRCRGIDVRSRTAISSPALLACSGTSPP